MCQHGIGHFHKAGDVGAVDIIHEAAAFMPVLQAGFVDIGHDVVKVLVHFFGRPRHAQRVLAHFQAGSGHAAGVAGFARRIEDLRLHKGVYRGDGAGHIRAFGHADAAVTQEHGRIGFVELVLGGAGQGDVAGHMPRAQALMIRQTLFLGIHGKTRAALVFQFFQRFELQFGHAFGEMHKAV